MSAPSVTTTQVVKCPSCGQYYPDNEAHVCGAPLLAGATPASPKPAVAVSDDPLIGTVVGGRYKILTKLGQGGMGAVYEAVQDSIERRVAIKVLLPAIAKDTEAAKRFTNEARAVNRVNHPGLVQISDFGQLDSGPPFFVMELLTGETLRQRMLRLGGALPLTEVIELGSQMAESLTAAHALGIIHRDLKPENVMIVADPHMPQGERTKLLDFGIAKFTGDKDKGSSMQTQVSVVMGSPAYMSPEQVRGAGHVDDRTDVYALGCMLYEMLAGRPPFIGNSLAEVMGKQQFELPLPLGKLTAGVPAALLALVDRLLIKDKAQRPPMSQLLEALEILREQLPRVMQRRSARMPTLGPAPQLSPTRFASTLSQSVGQGLQRLRTTTPSVLIGAAAGILILGGLFTYDRLSHRPPPPIVTTPALHLPPPILPVPADPGVSPVVPPAIPETTKPAVTPDPVEPEPAKVGHHHAAKPDAPAKIRKHHRHSVSP